MREEFSTAVRELLAKRVAQRCSNLGCRKPTSGPQEDPSKAVSLGVAAHIAAASPGGPRYDATMTSDERSAMANGIWLCQNCAKLIDNDPAEYTSEVIRAWRSLAEATAKRDLERGRDPEADAPFVPLERQMPALLAEMRRDLGEYPLSREFVLLKKGWSYWARGHELAYFYEDHPALNSIMLIMENRGAISDVTFNNVKRYVMSEEFVEYLTAGTPVGHNTQAPSP